MISCGEAAGQRIRGAGAEGPEGWAVDQAEEQICSASMATPHCAAERVTLTGVNRSIEYSHLVALTADSQSAMMRERV